MIRVIGSSRLHFGLFRLPSEGRGLWLDLDGNPNVPARVFGGVGLMIDRPGVNVSVAPAEAWSATGPRAERALANAQQFLKNCPEVEPQAFALTVEQCAPEHVGLGTGTQLGLAVAQALALALGHREWDAVELARRSGRGLRSAIGVHGFQHGGFLVDGGKTDSITLAPLIARHDFPKDWSILLVLPGSIQGVYGPCELDAFAQLAKNAPSNQQTDALCRLVLLGILPALVERDLPAFGAALYDFNRRVGEMFRPWQKGLYANPRTAEIVDFLRKNGVHGAGQSSWGPTVFAIAAAERATHLAELMRKQFALSGNEVLICGADNGGTQASSAAYTRRVDAETGGLTTPLA